MRRRRSIPRPALVILGGLLLLTGMAFTGCNIFSWTHDEGSSDDPETLLEDAEDALLDRDWQAALAFAQRGIEQDPAPMQYPRLRWVAAQAVLADAGISVSSYLEVFTNHGGAGKAAPGRDTVAYRLLDLSLDELRAIAQACPQAVAFLREILDALEAGEIGPEDLLGIQFDVELGFGVGALLTAFVTTLDADQNLDNGFVQNPDVTIEAFDDGGYTFAYTGPGDPNAFIACTLVCPLWDLFCDALEGVYDAYRFAASPDGWPSDLGCSLSGVGALPGPTDEGFVIGQVLPFVHAGVQRLHQDWSSGCASCPTGGAR